MADVRELRVRVVGDDRDAQRMYDRMQRGARQTERSIGGTSRALTGLNALSNVAGRGGGFTGGTAAAAGAAIATTAILKATAAASALNEEISKSQQVFKDSADDVLAWSKTTASAIGLSQTAALRATGIFGNLFSAVGLSSQDSADMSKGLTQLAADLASFNNANVDDVLLALRSGLVGEAEPLRRFGVLLSEARVQQKALADTGKSTVDALTDQEKAMARYEIILGDTTLAQGDFDRTSGSLANQQRILRAETEDLTATMGGVFLPVVQLTVISLTGLVGGTNNLIGAFASLRQKIDDSGDMFDGWNEGVERATTSTGDFLQTLVDGIPLLTDWRDAVRGAFDDTDAGSPDALGAGGTGAPHSFPGAGRAEAEADAAEDAVKSARRARIRAQAAFREFSRGLGLKLDRAGLTAGLDDDIEVLLELERAVQRQIGREGRTFALVTQLTQVQAELASTRARRASNSARTARDAYSELIDSLELKLTQKMRTASFADDLRVLEQIERAIRARIAAEGRTAELLAQLDDVLSRQAQTVRDRAQHRRDVRAENQFEALGLTSAGEEKTPGTRTLRRRAESLKDRIRGTVLDTDETRSQLERIAQVLSGKFGEVGQRVRAAIDAMLDEIAGGLSGGGSSSGLPRTAFRVANFSQLFSNLGLTPEQERAVQQQFSRLGPGATISSGSRSGGVFGVDPVRDNNQTDVEVNVYIDGKKVAGAVDNVQTKKSQRKSGTRSGSRPGPRK